jgi:hypothetical protein
MPKNRKKLITKLINEGFTHRTLSLFSDKQLQVLSKKILKEAETATVKKTTYTKSEVDKMKQESGGLTVDGTVTPNDDGSVTVTTNEEEKPDEVEVTKDGEPITKFKYSDGEEKTLINSGDDTEMSEEAVSQSQYNFYKLVHACKKSNYKDCGDGRDDNAVLKAAKEMTLKQIEDYTTTKNVDDLPNKLTEGEILENWIISLVENNQPAEITKANFIKTVKETQNKTSKNKLDKQKKAFNMVNELTKEMNPPMKIVVENIKGDIKGYLKSPNKVIELIIKESGEVQLDGNIVGEENLDENSPLEAPTIAPPTTKPGEKKRRGPFKVPNPSTKPKPKARKNKLPDWLTFDNITEE